MTESDRLLTVLAGVLVLGVGAQWIAWRIRAPAIYEKGSVKGWFLRLKW